MPIGKNIILMPMVPGFPIHFMGPFAPLDIHSGFTQPFKKIGSKNIHPRGKSIPKIMSKINWYFDWSGENWFFRKELKDL